MINGEFPSYEAINFSRNRKYFAIRSIVREATVVKHLINRRGVIFLMMT